MTEFYIVFSTFIWLLLGVVWKNSDWLNVILKFIMIALAIVGAFLSFKIFSL